jgi:hypothetical protein
VRDASVRTAPIPQRWRRIKDLGRKALEGGKLAGQTKCSKLKTCSDADFRLISLSRRVPWRIVAYDRDSTIL